MQLRCHACFIMTVGPFGSVFFPFPKNPKGSSASTVPGDCALLHPALFFDTPRLKLQRIIGVGASLTFVIHSTAPTASCPLCGQSSARPHSRYVRTLADLPCHDQPVRIQLEVRRFFCSNADCPRRVFAERLPMVAAVHARTTVRLHNAHCNIGVALGGEAGARLAAKLSMPTSADTLLRRVRRGAAASATLRARPGRR